MISLSDVSVLLVSLFRSLAKTLPGPGESCVTVAAYPLVSPAVITAVHHAVFIFLFPP